MAAVVRVTDNFLENLRSIETFCKTHDVQPAFSSLLDTVFESLLPNLEQFPEMGRLFFERLPQSVEGLRLQKQLRTRYKSYAVREYLLKQHIVLYAFRGEVVYLLAIKDFRQLSYDFASVGK
jgi:hypothetical protein